MKNSQRVRENNIIEAAASIITERNSKQARKMRESKHSSRKHSSVQSRRLRESAITGKYFCATSWDGDAYGEIHTQELGSFNNHIKKQPLLNSLKGQEKDLLDLEAILSIVGDFDSERLSDVLGDALLSVIHRKCKDVKEWKRKLGVNPEGIYPEGGFTDEEYDKVDDFLDSVDFIAEYFTLDYEWGDRNFDEMITLHTSLIDKTITIKDIVAEYCKDLSWEGDSSYYIAYLANADTHEVLIDVHH